MHIYYVEILSGPRHLYRELRCIFTMWICWMDLDISIENSDAYLLCGYVDSLDISIEN